MSTVAADIFIDAENTESPETQAKVREALVKRFQATDIFIELRLPQCAEEDDTPIMDVTFSIPDAPAFSDQGFDDKAKEFVEGLGFTYLGSGMDA